MTAPAPISASQLAQRFGLTKREAQRWLRELPHVQKGRRRFTTEDWLAQWMAAHLKHAPKVCGTSPLDSLVAERAAWCVAELVRQGKLAVLPTINSELKGAA